MLPYETVARDLEKTTNNQVFAVDFPHRAFITKIVVSETSGANIAPTVDLFSVDPTTLESADREPPYKVIPTLQMAAGKIAEYISKDLPYFNHMPATGGTPVRKIYVRINGNTNATYDIAVAGYSGMI